MRRARMGRLMREVAVSQPAGQVQISHIKREYDGQTQQAPF